MTATENKNTVADSSLASVGMPRMKLIAKFELINK